MASKKQNPQCALKLSILSWADNTSKLKAKRRSHPGSLIDTRGTHFPPRVKYTLFESLVRCRVRRLHSGVDGTLLLGGNLAEFLEVDLVIATLELELLVGAAIVVEGLGATNHIVQAIIPNANAGAVKTVVALLGSCTEQADRPVALE